VLREINFSVKSGQTVALVGHSGAGKTTIANLLMRFWDPDEGSIFLGGYKLKQFTLEELRQNIAMVSQDTYLFNASIIDNLRMAKHDATEAEIQNATTIANAHEFIESFPDRYDTEIGERGIRLSGGQRQRLSIARAVLKDAPVLILDEATSHLDMISEQQVREAFQNVTAGRTTLVIAHRLSTVRDSDHIVVLNHGRIDEEGTHEFLLKSNGAYSRLVSTQILGTSG
jgi:ABC-type multidrug transport system fused ATPase/permease subunit